jgi:hypothetical protein
MMTFDEWYTSITIENWDSKELMLRAWNAATKAEREACAEVCDSVQQRMGYGDVMEEVRSAIRSRQS